MNKQDITIVVFLVILLGGWLYYQNGQTKKYRAALAERQRQMAIAAATNNIPTLKYGRFVARAGAKLKIRNPEALKDFGTKRPVLDLSGVENLSGTENLELPTEHDELGRLFWNEEKTILYWRKHADGMMLIFR